jgi:hypothetical protein
MFERTVIGQIGGDPSRPETMIANRRVDAGCYRAPSQDEEFAIEWRCHHCQSAVRRKKLFAWIDHGVCAQLGLKTPDKIEGCSGIIASKGNRSCGAENLDLQCVGFSVHRASASLEIEREAKKRIGNQEANVRRCAPHNKGHA